MEYSEYQSFINSETENLLNHHIKEKKEIIETYDFNSVTPDIITIKAAKMSMIVNKDIRDINISIIDKNGSKQWKLLTTREFNSLEISSLRHKFKTELICSLAMLGTFTDDARNCNPRDIEIYKFAQEELKKINE